MTDLVPLSELRSAFPEGLERLYRLEVERWEPTPAASASEGPAPPSGFARYALVSRLDDEPEPQRTERGEWVRVYLISESEDRALDDIAEEVLDFIGSAEAKWRIRIFYWEGRMHNDYYNVDRKRGETVREAELIEIDTTQGGVR